jgi:hypothetical protein
MELIWIPKLVNFVQNYARLASINQINVYPANLIQSMTQSIGHASVMKDFFRNQISVLLVRVIVKYAEIKINVMYAFHHTI